MEEASALATKVGILAKRMLGESLAFIIPFQLLNVYIAIGTTEYLTERYATYEVHFTCRTREEVSRAQQLMANVPGARLADDVATRFEVPIQNVKNRENVPASESGAQAMTLAELFRILSKSDDFSEYTVEKASLESVFLKVIRQNNVLEEDTDGRKKPWWRCL